MKGKDFLLYLTLTILYTGLSYINFQGVVIALLTYLFTERMVNWNNKN